MKTLKKMGLLLISAAIILCFSACGGDNVPDVDLADAAQELANSGAFTDMLSQPAEGVPAQIYGFEDGDVTECVMYYGTGATAEEIFLAKAADSDAAQALADACRTRVENQKIAFESYVPEEIPKLNNADMRLVGDYVILVVSNDSGAVGTILDSYFGS